MLYPLSYERLCRNSLRQHAPRLYAADLPVRNPDALPPFRATPPTRGNLRRDSGEVTRAVMPAPPKPGTVLGGAI